MSEETKNEPIEKEETPEWAKNLEQKLADLPSRLKEVLTPEAPPPNQPIEIPLPQEPEPPEVPKPQEVEVEPPQEPEKPKKRRLLDWLL